MHSKFFQIFPNFYPLVRTKEERRKTKILLREFLFEFILETTRTYFDEMEKNDGREMRKLRFSIHDNIALHTRLKNSTECGIFKFLATEIVLPPHRGTALPSPHPSASLPPTRDYCTGEEWGATPRTTHTTLRIQLDVLIISYRDARVNILGPCSEEYTS